MKLGWVPTEDYLPDEGREVLVVHSAKTGRNLPVKIAKLEEGRWYSESHQLWPPSHWMPIPEPPATRN
jgi:hypothetical protein